MNQQPIEKQFLHPEGDLEVHSIFLTIQGEGPFTGQRAVFVRLAGCNLQCPGCDTDYTSRRTTYPKFELLHLIMAASKETRMLVVFTGGEPFRQNLKPITDLLLDFGYDVQVETNGTLYQDLHQAVTVVCSPKSGSINPKLGARVVALKYVVKAGDVGTDGLPLHALDHSCGEHGVAKPNQANMYAHVYVQPMDEKDESKNAANLQTAIATVMDRGYTLCIQTHKIINVE